MDPADPAPLGGKIALTFDDGPSADTTPDVLATLRRHGVPATFFQLGQALADPANADVEQEIADDPLFDAANHTWDHTDVSTLSLDSVAAEMDDTTAELATFGLTPSFFRFPYGVSSCDTHDLATDRGMHVTGWHIDTGDWCYAYGDGVCTVEDYWRVPPEYESDMLGWILEQVHRFDGGIFLFHDIHWFTADSLEEVVSTLEDEGYDFVPLSDTTAFPLLNSDAPADFPFLGEACDPAADTCWEVEHAAWCEPISEHQGICTVPCEGYCLDRDGGAGTFCADVGAAGQCVARAETVNDQCALLPGTEKRAFDRFIGSSGAGADTVNVCVPPLW